jgi:hypothetical protein
MVYTAMSVRIAGRWERPSGPIPTEASLRSGESMPAVAWAAGWTVPGHPIRARGERLPQIGGRTDWLRAAGRPGAGATQPPRSDRNVVGGSLRLERPYRHDRRTRVERNRDPPMPLQQDDQPLPPAGKANLSAVRIMPGAAPASPSLLLRVDSGEGYRYQYVIIYWSLRRSC